MNNPGFFLNYYVFWKNADAIWLFRLLAKCGLLSGTPRVRIAPGTPNPRKHYVFGGLLFVFLFKPVRSIHIQKCIDYDAVSGLMYSVSTSAPDLDGFDIGAAADWLYMPARGKTEPFPMEDALALLTDSTGYAGSAGGSLKGAIAAERTLAFAVEQTPLSWNRQTMYTAFVDAFMALDADKKEEFSGNLENIEWLINTAFDDYETVADLFEDSGTAENMAALLSNPDARTQWNALDSLLSNLV